MKTTLFIYSPALVLAAWSGLWKLGLTGNTVIVIGLAATAVTVVLHCLAEFGKHRNGGPSERR